MKEQKLIERADNALIIPSNRVSVGLFKYNGALSISLAVHDNDPREKVKIYPLTVDEAKRFRESLARAIDVVAGQGPTVVRAHPVR